MCRRPLKNPTRSLGAAETGRRFRQQALKGRRRSDADDHAEACGGTDGQRIYDQKPAVEFLGDDLRVTREAGYQRKVLGEMDSKLIEKEEARIPNTMLVRQRDSIAAEGICCRPPTIVPRRQHREFLAMILD